MKRPVALTRLHPPCALLPLIAVCALNAHCQSSELLFGFGDSFDLNRVQTTDARVAKVTSGDRVELRVVTGHQQPWPGIALPAPTGSWDLSPYSEIAVQLSNPGVEPITVSCRADNPGADGTEHCVTGSLDLAPGRTGRLKVILKCAGDNNLGGKLFGMRGYPVAPGGPGTVQASHITQLLIFLSKPSADHRFQLAAIQAEGQYIAPTAWTTDAAPFFPFIDTFGQYRHKSWPGKTKDLDDLQLKGRAEAKELEANHGPADWDKYGGWAVGPQRQATGFFRTEKVHGKWWLVDPAGRLFFSHGIDCVREVDTTPIEERDLWFEDLPASRPEFKEFVSTGFALKGHYQGRSPRCFSFAGANLARKYGPDWKKTYPELIHRRLRSWGLNTIGNWSDEATRLLRRTPYTDAIGSGRCRMRTGSEGYWGKFPDVFDSSFGEALRRSMQTRNGKSAGDPWCIGYFSDNEMSWGDEVSLAVAALRSPPDQAAKLAFVSDLKTEYGDIARLNEAWGAKHESWDGLLQARKTPPQNPRTHADLTAFYTKTAERYFCTVRDAIKALAPHQLYLGCRFAWVNPLAAAAAAKYCDVVSYNLYRRSVADFRFNGGADVPLLIGEFHFGALDRGMFHTGLVPVAGQAARAEAYKEYVRGALQHPQFVGCHWFQYKDEPVTGRVYDEENYQIGFVDVADTPYQETIAVSREAGSGLYREAWARRSQQQTGQ